MAGQTWAGLVTPNTPQGSGAGAALTTATTATLSPTTGSGADVAQINQEGQYQGWYAGLILVVTGRGFITTTATGTTFTPLLAARVGNTGSTYVTLATGAGVSTPAAANTGIQWDLNAIIRCTSVATSGSTVSTQGSIKFYALAAQTILTATAATEIAIPNASGETAAAVDTTQVQGISFRGTLAGANATVQLTQWVIEGID